MRVLFIASEMTPYASTGGLADVASSLPAALMEKKVEIRRILPLYRQIIESNLKIYDTGLRIDVPVGLNNYAGEVWLAENPKPATYFIKRDEFFDRTHLYGSAEREYDDNIERFIFFQKAVIAMIDALELHFDIVHCNDWESALIPLFLKGGIDGRGRECKEKSVFTIHNIAYQGIYPAAKFSLTNLPMSCFSVSCLEFYGKMNTMKAGIITADSITTVSRRYAEEIQTSKLGCGLEGVVANRSTDLKGIFNGIDDNHWDPNSDKYIKSAYRKNNIKGKALCKREMTQRYNLKNAKNLPLIGMVSRLIDEKGLDILSNAIQEIMALNVSIIIHGEGDETHQKKCLSWMQSWPNKFAAQIGFSREFAHQIFAAADIILIPSHHEPCGLNQFYAMRYGALPIAHATGGLRDTIRDIDENHESGNGFLFTDYSPEALVSAIKRAVRLFRTKYNDIWIPAMTRAMDEDHSWRSQTDEYIKLYESTLASNKQREKPQRSL